MYKKRIIVLLGIIIIYCILSYIYSTITKETLLEVYVVGKNIKRGESINLENSYKIKIDKNKVRDVYLENIDNMVAKYDLKEGQIINYSNIVNKSEYIDRKSDNSEIVILDLNGFDGSIQRNLSKDMTVNLYYTGKSSQIENFFSNFNYKKVKNSNTMDSYTTILLLENVIVNAVYNKEGKEVEDGLVQKIGLEVDEDMAIIIENIKNYGIFDVTIKR